MSNWPDIPTCCADYVILTLSEVCYYTNVMCAEYDLSIVELVCSMWRGAGLGMVVPPVVGLTGRPAPSITPN